MDGGVIGNGRFGPHKLDLGWDILFTELNFSNKINY